MAEQSIVEAAVELEQPLSLELVVRQMRWEADDVLSVTFARPDGTDLPPWQLGAHVDVSLQPDLIRQYSLCSRPAERGVWTVAVLLDPQSTGGSSYIHEQLRPGMVLQVVGPRNNFPLVEASEYLFIAGGIGVTPLLPMVQQLAEANANWRMLYGGRRRASMAFLQQLAPYGEHVEIRPEEEFGLLDLKSAIGGVAPDAAVYCCGPEPLIAAVEQTCATLQREAAHIERFKGRELDIDTSHDTSFEIVIEKTGEHLTVEAEETILGVLERHGVWVPNSCTEGYCGVCETEVVAGIPDHRDDYLSDAAHASNKVMMICVGRSKTPELVLKLAL